MDLDSLRREIDALDGKLLRLLNERAGHVREIGQLKRESGREIYAPEREEQVLKALTAKNAEIAGLVNEQAVRAIYREIMSASLALEKDLTIAYLGPEATWTHQAARNKFGTSVRYAPQFSISDVFEAIARGRADYGVVPIENSTEGAVNHTLDVFIESDLRICAQLSLKIENHLLSRVGRDQIRRLFSHPQVFGQCRQWLRINFPKAELIEVSDRQSRENSDALKEHPVGILERQGDLGRRAFGVGRIGNTPMRRHRLAGPNRTGFARRVVADCESKIERRRAGPCKLAPRF